jgi:hypothetical protein
MQIHGAYTDITATRQSYFGIAETSQERPQKKVRGSKFLDQLVGSYIPDLFRRGYPQSIRSIPVGRSAKTLYYANHKPYITDVRNIFKYNFFLT